MTNDDRQAEQSHRTELQADKENPAAVNDAQWPREAITIDTSKADRIHQDCRYAEREQSLAETELCVNESRTYENMLDVRAANLLEEIMSPEKTRRG